MCLILFSLDRHPRYPLIIAANRDEAYRRPSAPLAFWPDAPHVAGGRDLEGGGTWLAIARDGRWAALTNYRQAGSYRLAAPSRGHLVADYLLASVAPDAYMESVRAAAERYNGFNLLVGRGTEVYYFSNRGDRIARVAPGSHGLSNHLLDTPWPKVALGRRMLDALPDDPGPALTAILMRGLQGRSAPLDAELPDTGVGLERERVLAPPFIVSETYGTRASTVVLVDRSGSVSVVEESFGPMGMALGGTGLEFALDGAAAASMPCVPPKPGETDFPESRSSSRRGECPLP